MRKFFKKLSGFDADNEDEVYADAEDPAVEAVLEAEEAVETEGELEPETAGDNWVEEELEEGQLSIDVFQTPDSIVVKSTIAGVKPEDIDISMSNDMLTIRGRRTQSTRVRDEDYLYRECYWGSFSRSLILPIEVEADKIEAVLENGVLTVTLPKIRAAKPITIKVKGR